MKQKQKISIISFIVFSALFILSMDLWGWNRANSVESLILGLPLWIYYIIFLTLMASIFFYVLSRYVWSDGH